nr:hypothetical protein [uncultured Ralstonia sp.]
MKKSLISLVFLMGSGLVFAQPAALSAADTASAQPATQQQLRQMPSTLDPFRFCYFKNEAYSIGSVRDGLKCDRTGVQMHTNDGALDRDRSDPLRWIPANRKTALMD